MTKLNTVLSKNLYKAIISTVAVALLVGCSSNYTEKSAQKTKNITDANIAAIVVGANEIDISAGKIALQRSNNYEIKKFAQRMITDHQAVLDGAVKLVTKLGVTPVNNDLVAALSKQSKEHEASLRTLKGKAFDKKYIDHEVAYHMAVIDVIEKQLIPSVKSGELKKALISVVPAFKVHLEHSKMIQSQL